MTVSQATIYALVASGRLAACRIGLGRGCIRFTEEQVAEFLAGAQPAIPSEPAAAPQTRLKHLNL